jgi:hypothetical protein
MVIPTVLAMHFNLEVETRKKGLKEFFWGIPVSLEEAR